MGQAHIRFESVTVGYGGRPVQRDLDFTIGRGDIFAIMGPSGCGKSTLMRSAIGLLRPSAGRILYGEDSFWDVGPERQKILMRAFGVMYQGGACVYEKTRDGSYDALVAASSKTLEVLSKEIAEAIDARR